MFVSKESFTSETVTTVTFQGKFWAK